MAPVTMGICVFLIPSDLLIAPAPEMRTMKGGGRWSVLFMAPLTSPLIPCTDIQGEKFIKFCYLYFHIFIPALTGLIGP